MRGVVGAREAVPWWGEAGAALGGGARPAVAAGLAGRAGDTDVEKMYSEYNTLLCRENRYITSAQALAGQAKLGHDDGLIAAAGPDAVGRIKWAAAVSLG
jgi:hypothetical protein